jgi:hypothetical protein
MLHHKTLKAEDIQGSICPLEEAVTGNRIYRNIYDKDVPSTILMLSEKEKGNVISNPRGLIGAASVAYNMHHDLVLRPDDVWQAIVTQFSFYVQANAEALRDKLVSHEGKKELVVCSSGSLFSAPYGSMAKSMLLEIAKNVKDPSITEWLSPNFTTTTDTDRVAAAISVMATMQAYFNYTFGICCGLPSVELLGTVEDWQMLLAKAKRLGEFDLKGKTHMAKWQAMLLPVLEEFVKTKQGVDNMDWWQRICHYTGGGSGPTWLSGWITVFAVFDGEGKWQGNCSGSEWPRIDTGDLPTAVLTCPVTVNDNGKEYKTHIFAGQFCFETKSGKDVVPRTDWCLAISNDQL